MTWTRQGRGTIPDMSDATLRWLVAVLAAGQGTRMRSATPKVLHELAGRPLIDHVLDLALAAARQPSQVVVVVGHGGDRVAARVAPREVTTALQEPQLGTGDAVRVAVEAAAAAPWDALLVLSGDVPLLRSATVAEVQAAVAAGRDAALVTAELEAPAAYGRVLRTADGLVREIVEARDATPEVLAVREVNAGIYGFRREPLAAALTRLEPDNAQGEYYLTDVVGDLRAHDRAVAAVRLADPDEMAGVNTRADLARVGGVFHRRVVEELMAAGVTVEDPASARVDPRSSLGRDVVLELGVVLRGACRVGDGAVIGAHSVLTDAVVPAGTHVPPLSRLGGDPA